MLAASLRGQESHSGSGGDDRAGICSTGLQDSDVCASNIIKMAFENRVRVCRAGPRIKMGLYSGVPIKVVPHTTTGRADYFGTLVRISTLPGALGVRH